MKPQDLFLLYEQEVAQFKLDLIRRLSDPAAVLEAPRQKRTSNFSMIEAVLVAAGKPLHVTEIIAAIEKEFNITLDRDSLSSAILKQVRKEKRFIRVVAEEDHFIEGKASDRLSQRAEADGLAFGNARRSVRPIHEMRRFFMDRLYKII
jgi:hypothetical protein